MVHRQSTDDDWEPWYQGCGPCGVGTVYHQQHKTDDKAFRTLHKVDNPRDYPVSITSSGGNVLRRNRGGWMKVHAYMQQVHRRLFLDLSNPLGDNGSI